MTLLPSQIRHSIFQSPRRCFQGPDFLHVLRVLFLPDVSGNINHVYSINDDNGPVEDQSIRRTSRYSAYLQFSL